MEGSMKIPNCKLCKWLREMEYAIIGHRYLCEAQGLQACDDVYNSAECQFLYIEKRNNDKK